MLNNILDLLSLVIQIIGTVVMFLNAPKNVPQGTFITAGTPDYETPKKRQRRTRKGFFLLAIGFSIQLLSLVIKII